MGSSSISRLRDQQPRRNLPYLLIFIPALGIPRKSCIRCAHQGKYARVALLTSFACRYPETVSSDTASCLDVPSTTTDPPIQSSSNLPDVQMFLAVHGHRLAAVKSSGTLRLPGYLERVSGRWETPSNYPAAAKNVIGRVQTFFAMH